MRLPLHAQVPDSTALGIPAHVIDEKGSFSTRSFLVRYIEEALELNECAMFRLELVR